MQKVRDIERKVWTDELADMHRVVDEELRAVRQMATGLVPESTQTSSASYPHSGTGTHQQASDSDADDGDFDIKLMKLKLGSDEDSVCPAVPEFYLTQSPMLDRARSSSRYVNVKQFVVINSLC